MDFKQKICFHVERDSSTLEYTYIVQNHNISVVTTKPLTKTVIERSKMIMVLGDCQCPDRYKSFETIVSTG